MLNNTAGLFIPPVTTDLGFSVGTFTLYFSVAAIVTMIFLPIGGKLMATYDPRQVILGAITLQAGSIALFGVMSSVWGWYLLAIPLSMGGTIITVVVGPVLINQWYKARNGPALGILAATGGLIGAIAQPVTSWLITSYGWRMAYMAIGLFTLGVVIAVTLLLIRKSPQALGLHPLGAEEVPAPDAPVTDGAPVKGPGIDIKIARTSLPLLLLALFFFFITAVSSFSQHIPTHVANLGFKPEFAGTVMFWYMIGVLIGSLVLGTLVDLLGSRLTAILTMIVGFAAIATFIATTENRLIIIVSMVFFGSISASIGIIAPRNGHIAVRHG